MNDTLAHLKNLTSAAVWREKLSRVAKEFLPRKESLEWQIDVKNPWSGKLT